VTCETPFVPTQAFPPLSLQIYKQSLECESLKILLDLIKSHELLERKNNLVVYNYWEKLNGHLENLRKENLRALNEVVQHKNKVNEFMLAQ